MSHQFHCTSALLNHQIDINTQPFLPVAEGPGTGKPAFAKTLADFPPLVEYFIDRYAKKAGKNFSTLTNKTFQLFQAYDWPGNIRELQNVIERAVIL